MSFDLKLGDKVSSAGKDCQVGEEGLSVLGDLEKIRSNIADLKLVYSGLTLFRLLNLSLLIASH